MRSPVKNYLLLYCSVQHACKSVPGGLGGKRQKEGQVLKRGSETEAPSILSLVGDQGIYKPRFMCLLLFLVFLSPLRDVVVLPFIGVACVVACVCLRSGSSHLILITCSGGARHAFFVHLHLQKPSPLLVGWDFGVSGGSDRSGGYIRLNEALNAWLFCCGCWGRYLADDPRLTGAPGREGKVLEIQEDPFSLSWSGR